MALTSSYTKKKSDMMPSEEHKPSKYAIVPYYLVGAICFVLVSLLCFIATPAFLGHYFQPKLLAITHLAALGWAVMIIFGASNQLMPVITEQKLHSDKIPKAVLAIKVIGICLLIPSFWNFTFLWYTYLGGSLILLAFILHSINLYKTAKKAKDNIISDFILTAHVWLILTAIIGLLLLINFRFPFLPQNHLHYLKLHATVGMLGWFFQLIIGVSARLIPMFLLSRAEKQKWLMVSYYCINSGLILFLLEGMAFQTSWGLPVYFIVLLTGMLYYIRYVRLCYSSAIRKQMDQGMKQTFLALLLLSVPFLLLLAILFLKEDIAPNVATAYGFSFFAGIISVIIMGQTFKTLPFIVWMHIAEPDNLPELLPKDLFHETWVKWQMLIYLPGFLSFLSGILFKQLSLLYVGSGLMTIAAVWYCLHVCLIIKKLRP